MAIDIISFPKDASHWQQQLFTLHEPVTLPKYLFEQVWPLVSSVYTFRNKKLQQKGTIEVEHGECRLKKSRKSSSTMVRPGNTTHHDSEIKRRNSSIREKDQCLVTVKLTRQITGSNPTVTLERKDDQHSHPLETSFMVKESKQVQELINKETAKNYSADGEQEVPGDNGRVEAILDVRVIEEQLQQLTCSP